MAEVSGKETMTGDRRTREYQILVIEDDFLKARLLVASLQTHLGTRHVFVARDGDQAFNLIREHDPDVILLNMNLARPSGVEFLRLLHQNRNGKGFNIVAMTQRGQGDLRSAASTFGAMHFVEAPYSPTDLSASVGRAAKGAA